MDWTPHSYQRDIVKHQLTLDRSATWAGMGLGKTVATLTAIDAMQTGSRKMALVLAPLRVAQSTWPDEARKWAHLRKLEVTPIVGSAKAREQALQGDAVVHTVNYEQIPWLIDYWCKKGRWPYHLIVADESTRLKGFRLRQGTKRAQALAKVAHGLTKRWVNLTGTPAPNGLEDLWGQQWFVDKGARLGSSFTAFAQRWFREHPSGYGITALPHAQREIEERLRDVCLTIRDGLPVDKPIVNRIAVDLPTAARSAYRDLEKKYFAELRDGAQIDAANAAVKSGKLLQIANGSVYTDDKGAWSEVHDAKLRALESVIEEAAGAPVLVAYHFRSDLERLQKAFPRARVLDKDPATIREWNAGKIPILLAHPASAGHGLNLQDGGHHLAFYSLSWNLEEHDQIIERIGPVRQRQAGHNRPVFVHYLLAEDTIDEIVLDRLLHKRSVQDVLMDAMRRKL